MNIDEIFEKEGITPEEVEKLFQKKGELGDDELDSVSGGACTESDTYKCPKCSSPLTYVRYHDTVDNTTRAYYLCYKCRKYGAKLEAGTLWPLPDNFVSWILEKAVRE